MSNIFAAINQALAEHKKPPVAVEESWEWLAENYTDNVFLSKPDRVRKSYKVVPTDLHTATLEYRNSLASVKLVAPYGRFERKVEQYLGERNGTA